MHRHTYYPFRLGSCQLDKRAPILAPIPLPVEQLSGLLLRAHGELSHLLLLQLALVDQQLEHTHTLGAKPGEEGAVGGWDRWAG